MPGKLNLALIPGIARHAGQSSPQKINFALNAEIRLKNKTRYGVDLPGNNGQESNEINKVNIT